MKTWTKDSVCVRNDNNRAALIQMYKEEEKKKKKATNQQYFLQMLAVNLYKYWEVHEYTCTSAFDIK